MVGHRGNGVAMQCGHTGCMTEAVLRVFRGTMVYVIVGGIDLGFISGLSRVSMGSVHCIYLHALCDEHREHLRLKTMLCNHDGRSMQCVWCDGDVCYNVRL